MIRIVLLSTLIFAICSVKAQLVIRGKVFDNIGKILAYSTIEIKSDSIVMNKIITDSLGTFELKNLVKKQYRIELSHSNYITKGINIFLVKDTSINIILDPAENKLKNVTVLSTKPIFEKSGDKYIYNVGINNLAKGNSAWDLLKETPLINTSEEGNISISGSSGARVYVNNRKSFFSGQTLMNYLKGIVAENIERIEIITVPSSRYEAEGSGGIINIVVKKNTTEGFKGSYLIGTKQTEYNSQNGNINLNYKNKNTALFGNLQTSNQNLLFTGESIIDYKNNGIVNYTNSNDIKRKLKDKIELSPSLGIDFQLTKKSSLGLFTEFSSSKLSRDNNTMSTYKDIYRNAIDSFYHTLGNDKEKTTYISPNINYEIKTDSLGGALRLNADYFFYSENRHTQQKTTLMDAQYNALSIVDDFLSTLPQLINNISFSLDYERKIDKNKVFEAGGKYSNSQTQSDVLFLVPKNSIYVRDSSRSNFFKYSEKINAIYSNFNQTINDKLNFQVGLRLEYTQTKANQVTYDSLVTTKYVKLFPSAYLNYILNRKNQFSLALSSRINRPTFWDINPFRYYTSPFIYNTGNPFLQPSKVLKQELTYNYNSSYIFQLVYENAVNVFNSLAVDDNQTIYYKKLNYGNAVKFYFNFLFTKKIKPYWNLRLNTTFGKSSFKGSYDNIIVDQSSQNASIDLNNSFTLSKVKKVYLTVITANNFKHYTQNTLVGNQFSANIWLRKLLDNNKGIIALGISDIFKSSRDLYYTDLNSLNYKEKYYYDNRAISLSFTYRFGKNTVKSQSNKNTSNNDEKERLSIPN